MHKRLAKIDIRILIVILLVALVAIALVILLLLSSQNQNNDVKEKNTLPQSNEVQQNNGTQQNVSWSFNKEEWSAQNPPSCSEPLNLSSPVDLDLVSAILYPGQVRGGDFKAHGGFRFDNNPDNQVTVKLPMDAYLYQGARYIESGEVQYMLDFIAPCGIMFRFDHLLTLTPVFEEIVQSLPEPKLNESRTTHFDVQTLFKKDQVIATEVGFKQNRNVSVDFGVYDLRTKNEASKDSAWANQYSSKASFAFYGLCWLNNLTASEKLQALALPGSGTEGKTSVYCK